MTDDTHNGWKNYETWNVALWIGNDEGLYDTARDFRHSLSPYADFCEYMKELRDDIGGDIGYQTPDGVAWNDSGLDIPALDEMIEEL